MEKIVLENFKLFSKKKFLFENATISTLHEINNNQTFESIQDVLILFHVDFM